MRTRPALRISAIIFLTCVTAAATADSTIFYESEPNNTPAEANAVTGEVNLYGTMLAGDQDGFVWTVTDDDARKRWDFELQGIAGALTIVEILRVEYADNGTEVARTERLMKIGSRDGLMPAAYRDQLFEPGEYLIGIAYAGGPQAGASAPFRPPVGNLAFGAVGAPATTVSAIPEVPGAYRLQIAEGSRLIVRPNPGTNETRQSAHEVRPGKEFATFESKATAWYQSSFDKRTSAQHWDLEVAVPIGRVARARLVDAAGKQLATAITDSQGKIRFPDLAPGITTWYLEVTATEPGFIQSVSWIAVGERVAGEEAEPNNDKSLANQVDFSQAVTGRIGDDDSIDYFRFKLDQTAADQLLSLRVDTTPATRLRFCLFEADWTQAQCKDGTAPVELPDLLLTEGDWGLSISRAQQAAYSLTLESQGPIESGLETEPNDTVAFATGVPADLRIKGRFVGDETDIFRFMVPDEPQLWRFQVIGDEISEIGYYDGSGNRKATLRAAGGQKRLRFDDLFLMPGTHYLSVSGNDGGKYVLLARALGPPNPNGEIEPNDRSNKQRLALGQTRVGLLSQPNDSDYYRFFLANWDHIRLSLQAPPDGIIETRVYWYDHLLGHAPPGAAGEPVVLQGLFPPGDYYVELTPHEVSAAEYTLALERLPRFSCPADCEPNGMNQIYLAAPLPADLLLQGRSGNWRDWDYYELPAFASPTALRIHSPEPVRELALGPYHNARQRLSYDAQAGSYVTTVDPGEPQRLMINSGGDAYRLQLEFPNGPLTAVNDPLNASLDLVLDVAEVSAFRTQGQRVTGALRIVNPDDGALDLRLEAATSDHRWHAVFAQDQVGIPAGGRVDAPIEIRVPADAWADRPVRISVRAVDTAGRQAETWQDIDVGRDTPPVGATAYWPIPEALRGGFNIAWNPFGAEFTKDMPKASNLHSLRDGLTFPGLWIGWGHSSSITKEDAPKWTLDLPGDEALPVAGVAIEHFGTPGPYENIREATLLLSEDGKDFVEVLSFEAQPVETEQQFALERPMPARFARLRIDSTFREKSQQRIFAAEWKVILEPGFDLSHGKGFNLADPELGGHVVWDWPPAPNSPTGILSNEQLSSSAFMRRRSTKDYVIGFYQNRMAQISRIEWRYPANLAERWKNFETVEVSASRNSPVGPWIPLGEIDLGGAQTIGTLELPEPAWARFVRLTAHEHPDARGSHNPGLIRIWERPGGDDYRSVLTEWGDKSHRGWYEFQAGQQADAVPATTRNESRADAAPLAIATLARGEVSLQRNTQHWYRLTMPQGDNTLSTALTGDPTVRTVLRMEDAAGNMIPMRRTDKSDAPGRHEFEAIIEPGSDVWLNIAEPPRNVIFSWDTSASVNAYIPLINNSLVAFSGQVVPGLEAVNLMPFSMPPLLEQWYGEPHVLQTVLNDYRRGGSSSSAERTLKAATQQLAPRAGTKAIIVITDADTPHDGEMWGPMREVQPRIFAVGVAGTEMLMQHRLRDWALVNGGHYTQLRYEGEMEVAFDRATTLMHRPADYTVEVNSEFREAPGPGLLRVSAPEAGSGAAGTAVELILDASGSMLQRMDGKRRIAIAKDVLTEAVQKHIPAGTPVALRVFGHREPDACRTDLEIPLGPLEPGAAAAAIAGVQAMNLARTPIADSLAAVEADLGDAAGAAIVVLVTDGEETCGGQPDKVIEALQAKGFNINLNIVGFAIDDAELAAQFESWAELAGGRYFAADNQDGLSDAIEVALRIPFTVFDQGGNEIATGQVGGDAVELDQGIYRVVVNTATPRTFEGVVLEGESEVTLALD